MPLIDENWLKKHAGQYADWHPTIEVIRPGSKTKITIKSKDAEKAAIESLKRKK